MSPPPTIRQREALDRALRNRRPWRPDFRGGVGLDRMLVALCVAVPVLALAIVQWGGR